MPTKIEIQRMRVGLSNSGRNHIEKLIAEGAIIPWVVGGHVKQVIENQPPLVAVLDAVGTEVYTCVDKSSAESFVYVVNEDFADPATKN